MSLLCASHRALAALFLIALVYVGTIVSLPTPRQSTDPGCSPMNRSPACQAPSHTRNIFPSQRSNHPSTAQLKVTTMPYPKDILTRLPIKLLVRIIDDEITDPTDLHALRRASRFFNSIVAHRFHCLFRANFQLTIAYWDLRLSPWAEASALDLTTIHVPRNHRHGDFARRSHDALIHHAASHKHIRHLRAILRRPFPPGPKDATGNWVNPKRVWVGYQNALWCAAQWRWVEGLRELWRHRPVGWVMDRDTEREAGYVFFGSGNDLSDDEEE